MKVQLITAWLLLPFTLLAQSVPPMADNSCSRQWLTYEYGPPEGSPLTRQDVMQEAEAACIKACDAGSATACIRAARLTFLDEGCPAPFDSAFVTDTARCNDDSRQDDTREKQEHLAFEKAREIIEDQCHQGAVRSCTRLGDLFLYVDEDWLAGGTAAAAAELYSWSCRHEDAGACDRLGALYESGKGVAKDPERAASLHQFARETWARKLEPRCRDNDLDACLQLGDAYTYGVGVSADQPYAESIYESACRKGHALSCHQLAALYETLHNSHSASTDHAKFYYKKACDMGEQLGCSNLSALNENSSIRTWYFRVMSEKDRLLETDD